MHTRERGAAHINIFFFLVMLVLFLGALGFGYVQLTENTQLRETARAALAEKAQFRHDLLVYEHYVEDIGKVVGETGEYVGRPGFDYAVTDDGLTQKVLPNAPLPERVGSLLRDFARESGIPESTATPVASLLSGAKSALSKKDQRIQDVQGLNATLTQERNQLQSAVADANRQKADEVAALNQTIAEQRDLIDSQKRTSDQIIAGLRDEVRSRGEAVDTEKAERAAAEAAMRKAQNELQGRISALASQIALKNPPQQPDGSVLSASQVAGKAWVNLGRKDMLPRGTVFEITSPDTGAIKGYGRVARVEYDRAEVDLFDVTDRFDPIVKGDKIRNDLYSPNLRRNIYLMGRFSAPLNKPEVKLVLEQLGNKVHDELHPGVDLIIMGADELNEDNSGFVKLTETDEFKMAQELNIEIAPLNKVRDFLKLSTTE